MPLIPFPVIPRVPGVPQIPRLAGSASPVVASLLSAAQGFLWRSVGISSQWGIFDSAGKPLADPNDFGGQIGQSVGLLRTTTLSTSAVEYAKEMKISDFPVERGGFAAYNKVELPAEPMVTLCYTGSESDRVAFLAAIDAACKSTDLYSVVTPEAVYIEYSVEGYNYSRTSSKGANLLRVELHLKEIRQVSAQYTQSKSIPAPKGAGATATVDTGKVQPATPEQSTILKLKNKIFGG